MHQMFPGINPMGLGAPLGRRLSITPTKLKVFFDVYKYIGKYPQKKLQVLTQWDLVSLGSPWCPLVSLGMTLIYNPNKRKSILWSL